MSDKPVNRPSEEAVVKATGHGWEVWFRRLDKVGMDKQDHTTIARKVKQLGCERTWWQQTIAVQYERARGLRDVHQRSGGVYEISRMRTIKVSAEELRSQVTDGRKRRAWTGLKLPSTEQKILSGNPYFVFPMPDGRTSLHIVVEAKGDSKASITVVHRDLSGPTECETQKTYWTEKVDTLKSKLEGNS
jgi:hypothetical protein